MKWAKAAVFVTALTPLAWLIWGAFHDALGGNPVEYITHATGDWTMRFLLITLAVTPVRKLTNQQYLLRFRRMLGLFAFFYGCLHFLTYLWLDQSLDLASMSKDIFKRPFITAGFAAFVAMVPLAITSTKGMIKRLGGKRWQLLHRLIYFSAFAGVVHYWWLVKSDIRKPLMYGSLLAVLLALRLVKLPVLIPGQAPVRSRATR
jgi:methionine sulfoxide reductase heme-binding subunit